MTTTHSRDRAAVTASGWMLIVGTGVAVVIGLWLLFAPYDSATLLPATAPKSCAPAAVSSFDTEQRCSEPGLRRVLAAGLVAIAGVGWARLGASRVRHGWGPLGLAGLGAIIAAAALAVTPFTVAGDLYAVGGESWRARVDCDPPARAFRYQDTDGPESGCFDPGVQRLTLAAVAGAAGLILAAVGRPSMRPGTPSASPRT